MNTEIPRKMKNKKKKRLKQEIIDKLHQIDEVVCFYQGDKELRNTVCRKLRSIHNRLDKLTVF